MSNVTLNWRERNPDETGHKIYRSTSPIDVNVLPTPIAEVGADVESWEDTTADAYTAYYYRVSSVRDTTERVSREIFVPSVPLNMGVGPDELVGGDLRKAGFFGEVSPNDFITGNALASSIGLSSGTAQFSDEPWLKFCIDGEIVFVAKKTYRSGISWEQIYQAGAVYGTGDNGSNPSGSNRLQDATVTIGGDDYRVTLLKGVNGDPSPNLAGYDLYFTHGSEWNRLMYPIHSGVHTESLNPDTPSIPYAQWATYSDADLLVHRDFGNGAYSWTQETPIDNTTSRFNRGSYGVPYVRRTTSTHTNSAYGWRPALRLIP